MKNLFKKIPLIISILFLFFSLFVFSFVYKETNKNNILGEEASMNFEKEKNRRDKIKSVDTLIKSIKNDQALVENHFTSGSGVVPFLDNIEGLAPKVGAEAEISSIDILSGDTSGLVVEVKVSGSFSSIYRFLNLLENSPYELDFISMNINIAEKTEKIKTYKWEGNFKMKLLSFIQ